MRAEAGAIDVGGTKIEARLFDAELRTLDMRRTPTPTRDYESFIGGLSEQIAWLLERCGQAALPIGIGIPGLIDPESGRSFASNLPISGENVRATLRHRLGRDFVIGHDCMSFAYSEAHGGAGRGFDTVVGLIMGTGFAAGLCIAGRMPHRHSGLAVEIGHVGVPAHLIQAFALPVFPCGCGRSGCFERYVSGPGLAAIAAHATGAPMTAEAVVQAAEAGKPGPGRALDIWSSLAAECLATIQLVLDPDCIVLGGGLSRMAGILDRLRPELERRRLGHAQPPVLRIAEHGDSSGVRGMALLALHGDVA